MQFLPDCVHCFAPSSFHLLVECNFPIQELYSIMLLEATFAHLLLKSQVGCETIQLCSWRSEFLLRMFDNISHCKTLFPSKSEVCQKLTNCATRRFSLIVCIEHCKESHLLPFLMATRLTKQLCPPTISSEQITCWSRASSTTQLVRA